MKILAIVCTVVGAIVLALVLTALLVLGIMYVATIIEERHDDKKNRINGNLKVTVDTSKWKHHGNKL